MYWSKQFKKDYNKLLQNIPKIRSELEFVLENLLQGTPLPEKYQDHSLKGNLKGFRDCHVRGDIVLVYKVVENTLRLERIGSHSQLGL